MKNNKFQREFDVAAYVADYLTDTPDLKKQAELNQWLSESENNRRLFAELVDEKQTEAKLKEFQAIDTAATWQKTKALLQEQFVFRRTATRFINWKLVGAAAVLLIFIGAIMLIRRQSLTPQSEEIGVKLQNAIVPGKDQAILTLADGTKILVDQAEDGLLATQSGVKLTKTSSGEVVYTIYPTEKSNSEDYNTFETPKGGQFSVNLPNGTKVVLNAASSIRFSPRGFMTKSRHIELQGEAYFEVVSNRKRPFTVKTTTQDLEVLGTHFNIKAYEDEAKVTTTLIEGAVKINNSTYLKPGQKSELSKKGIVVTKADTEAATAWSAGKFAFSGQDFKSIMRDIARWYDVDLVYEYEPVNLHIAGGITRYANIKDALNILQETGEVNFRIERRTIYIMK